MFSLLAIAAVTTSWTLFAEGVALGTTAFAIGRGITKCE